MNIFEMEYVDKNGKPLDLNAKNEEGKPIANDGKGTWEFRHRVIAPLLLAIILPIGLIVYGVYDFFKEFSRYKW